MSPRVVSIVGGAGFLGRYVVQNLARLGYYIKVGCRDVRTAMHILPCGDVGQIKLIPTNVHRLKSVTQLIEGADIVINLAGIPSERGQQTFQAIHVDAAQLIAHVAYVQEVEQFIHISSLATQIPTSSQYAQTKATGEKVTREQFPDALIIRPGYMFGPEDSLFNRLVRLTHISPILPIIPGKTVQPVYVGDVAAALCLCVKKQYRQKTINLGGPEIYTWRALLETICRLTNRIPHLLSVSPTIATFIARATFNQFFSANLIHLMKNEMTLENSACHFKSLGIQPRSFEALLPSYLI